VSLSVPALLAAGMMAAYGVVAAVVVREGRRARIGVGALVRGVPSTVRSGLTLGLGDRVLRRLMLRSVLIGIVLSGVELLSPGTFATLLGGEERASGAYGLLTAAAFAASAGGAALAPVVAIRLGGGARAARLVSWLAAPAATLLAVPLLAAAGMGYVGIYLLLGIVGPLTSELLHDRVGSSERATMLSMESLTLQAGGVLSNLLIGALVTATSTAAGFGVVALALLGSGVLLLGIRDAARGNVTASDLSDGSAPETVGSADRMGTAGAA